MVERAMKERELDPEQLVICEVVTLEEARREGFAGSPTIRINSRDIAPCQDGPALACRVYRRRDGHISAIPDISDLYEALDRAIRPPRE
jgi:hypothetical protein